MHAHACVVVRMCAYTCGCACMCACWPVEQPSPSSPSGSTALSWSFSFSIRRFGHAYRGLEKELHKHKEDHEEGWAMFVEYNPPWQMEHRRNEVGWAPSRRDVAWTVGTGWACLSMRGWGHVSLASGVTGTLAGVLTHALVSSCALLPTACRFGSPPTTARTAMRPPSSSVQWMCTTPSASSEGHASAVRSACVGVYGMRV